MVSVEEKKAISQDALPGALVSSLMGILQALISPSGDGVIIVWKKNLLFSSSSTMTAFNGGGKSGLNLVLCWQKGAS